jgi:type IV secretory pathway VirB10-like protein
MEIRTSTVAIVAASCITVGAAGAYLASRPSPAASQAAPASNAATAGVEQSEAVVSDPPAPTTQQVSEPPAPTAPRKAPEAPRPAPAAKTRPLPAATAAPVTQQARAAVPEPPRTTPAPVVPAARPEPRQPFEPAAPAEPLEPKAPPAPKFVDLVISTDSVLGLQMETAVTSEKARVEDEVIARVTRDVRVGDRVAIPAGSQARGEVTMVERGGKVRDKARLGIRFTSVVLADGTRVPLETDTIYREGDSPTTESTAKIGGGAIGGAIIGGIFGGAKGAAIGAATGAGAGTAAVVAGGRNAATLPSGTPVTVRLVKPATVTLED